MTRPATVSAYVSPGRMLGEYLSDPVRMVIVGVTLFVLGYGARAENTSPFVFKLFDPLVGNTFSLVEILLIVIAILEVVRRVATRDYLVDRSPISRWMLMLGLVVGIKPLFHMFFAEGGFRIPLELVYLPTMVALFYVYLMIFRREELHAMVWMVTIAGLYKIVEGFATYFANGITWGLLTGWRDGLLLAMMVVGGLLGIIVKNDSDDRLYGRLRSVMIWALPFATLVFAASMRRSYMVGIAVAMPMLLFLVRGSERVRTVAISAIFVIGAIVSLSIVGIDAGDRVGAVADPSREGSSAYRLIEIYNVSQMIMERPLMGWPMGAQSVNRTWVNVDNVSSLIPHNIYLYTAWRGGAFGLLIFCGLMVAALRMNWRTVRAARSPLERFVSLWMLSTTVLVVIAGFTCPVVTDRLNLFLPFVLVMGSYLPGAWSERSRARLAPVAQPAAG